MKKEPAARLCVGSWMNRTHFVTRFIIGSRTKALNLDGLVFVWPAERAQMASPVIVRTLNSEQRLPDRRVDDAVERVLLRGTLK
jgi:hypothetical protein